MSGMLKCLPPILMKSRLILFESTPDSLPSNHEIKELFSLTNEYDLSYNIHLPLDISLGAPEPSTRHFALRNHKTGHGPYSLPFPNHIYPPPAI